MRIGMIIAGCKEMISQYCTPIRATQVIACLACGGKDAGFNLKQKEWGKFYHEIKENYKEIRVHTLWSSRIGEYILRFLAAKEDAEKNAEDGILDVFILSDCVNHNARLSRIMGRSIYIVDETNVYMWKNILSRFPRVKYSKYWNDYSIKRKDRIRNAEKMVQYFKLTEDEEREGREKMDAMNLSSPFICVSSRDSKYLAVTEPDTDCSYHDYRDSDINKIKLAAEYLGTRGIKTVRMGREIQGKADFDNCIDYANEYYDELLDIILSKECKFYLGDSNGLCLLPMVLNKPVALKNFVPVFLDSDALPYNPNSLYIFKKYYKKDENRFLSMSEMMQIEKKVRFDGHKYAESEIEVIENSEEEILDLAMEMNARLDGEWIETSHDIELQKKYQSIFRAWCQQEQYMECATMLPFKVGTMFLRKNAFLLE